MHEVIAGHLRRSEDLAVSTATLDDPEHGCSEAHVNETDVLIWWGHLATIKSWIRLWIGCIAGYWPAWDWSFCIAAIIRDFFAS